MVTIFFFFFNFFFFFFFSVGKVVRYNTALARFRDNPEYHACEKNRQCYKDAFCSLHG